MLSSRFRISVETQITHRHILSLILVPKFPCYLDLNLSWLVEKHTESPSVWCNESKE